MCSTSVFTLIMTMIYDLWSSKIYTKVNDDSLIFFNISFFYKMSLRRCDSFPDYDMICTLYMLTVSFSFLKVNFLHCLFSERFEKLFHAVFSLYMVFVLFSIPANTLIIDIVHLLLLWMILLDYFYPPLFFLMRDWKPV